MTTDQPASPEPNVTPYRFDHEAWLIEDAKRRADFVKEMAALKTRLHGTLAEVRVAPDALVSTLAILQTCPVARDVALFGTALHVTLTSPTAMPALRAHLDAARRPDAEVEAVTPSLEDVFVSLVAREVEA